MLPPPVTSTVCDVAPASMATAVLVAPAMLTAFNVTVDDTVAGAAAKLILSPVPLQVSVALAIAVPEASGAQTTSAALASRGLNTRPHDGNRRSAGKQLGPQRE